MSTFKISAPYNFVPLSTWVYIPEWGQQVSHDLPFKEGSSGEIAYTLITESPLLVGVTDDEHAATGTGKVREVRPFQMPDGRYAVPGASSKGMIRAVVEMCGFGRMRMLDDTRPGLRDITGAYVKDSYLAKLTKGKVKTGFMRRSLNGSPEIIPCSMARIEHRALEEALGINKPIFKPSSVAEKYAHWKSLCQEKRWQQESLRFSLDGENAVNFETGDKTGTPVFTGQINGKKKDFVFYDERPDPESMLTVDDAPWRDFLAIHGDQYADKKAKAGNEKAAKEMSWPGYWRRIYRAGGKVPVFYLQDKVTPQDEGTLRIGLAYMPKLAGDFSTHDMARHCDMQHAQEPGKDTGYDLADLLFGAVGEKTEDALRGRVSFEPALAEGKPNILRQDDTILSAPKSSYFPNYIKQDVKPENWQLKTDTAQYATYIAVKGQGRPVIRGFKRYPARPLDKTGVQALTQEQKPNKNVQVGLYTLPHGTRFTGRIVFHNLRPEELGALLFALTWNNQPGLRHSLGMGKAFGFGQVRIEIKATVSRIRPNDPDASHSVLDAPTQQHFLDAFTNHMEERYQGGGNKGWVGSPSMANLLAMADPNAAGDFPEELRHMVFEQKENEFVVAKKQGAVLADYAVATGRGDVEDLLPQATNHEAAGKKEDRAKHPWLKKQIADIKAQHHNSDTEIWGGQPLAKDWNEIEDPVVRSAVLDEIKAYWQAKAWWDNPPKGAKRKAKAIYDDMES